MSHEDIHRARALAIETLSDRTESDAAFLLAEFVLRFCEACPPCPPVPRDRQGIPLSWRDELAN